MGSRVRSLWLVLGVLLVSCRPTERDLGDWLIDRIGQYRARHEGRLPASLADLGIAETEEGPVYYEKLGGDGFVVWYGDVLGESISYRSDLGRWVEY